MAARPRQVRGVMALRRSGRDSVTVAAPGAGWSEIQPQARSGEIGRGGRQRRSAIRACLAPGGTAAAAQRYPVLGEDPVHEAVGPAGRAAASERMLSPASYLFFRSDASLARSAPVTRVPFLRVSATRTSRELK